MYRRLSGRRLRVFRTVRPGSLICAHRKSEQEPSSSKAGANKKLCDYLTLPGSNRKTRRSLLARHLIAPVTERLHRVLPNRMLANETDGRCNQNRNSKQCVCRDGLDTHFDACTLAVQQHANHLLLTRNVSLDNNGDPF